MFWLTRPPYLRWVAAAFLVIGALLLDLSGQATVPFPFVTRPIPAGAVVPADSIHYRDVPTGLLPPPGEPGESAMRDLAEGEPLTATAVGAGTPIPSGWWSVEVEMPGHVRQGTPVRLIAIEPSLDVEGVVRSPPETGPFATVGAGLVAVPPEVAGLVGRAAALGVLVVLVGT